MEKEEKVEGERKRAELMGEKLKFGGLAGKREGNTTPSSSWKFGLIQPDGTLIQDFNFSSKSNTLSARKLGANLWEMQPQISVRVAKMSRTLPGLGHHTEERSLLRELDEAAAEDPSEQPHINLREQVVALPMQHDLRVKKVWRSQEPPSPASYCSSMEMPPHRLAINPNSSLLSKGHFGESNQCLKTSTELLKVLNRIWSLEEKHTADMSLVKMLRGELEHAQAQIQELLQEKKRDQKEIDNLMKQITEHKISRRKEQDRIKDAVKLVEDKAEDELKLRRNSEKLHHKLVKELLEMKSLSTDLLRELEQERKARTLLEDLCDEFAKGIRDYERELRFVKHRSCKNKIGREGDDRLILHITEAWLDERMQMQENSRDISEKQSALDKLSYEIETFLRSRQCGNSPGTGPKNPSESNMLAHSLESFHVNEPASAPWKGNDEGDSVGAVTRCSQLSRGRSLKQANGFIKQEGEITSNGHEREIARAKMVKKKAQFWKSLDQPQLEEHVFERKRQLDREIPTKSRTDCFCETNNPRMPTKVELMQRSLWEGRSRITDADVDSLDTETRNPRLTSEDKNFMLGNNCVEGSVNQFTGLCSPLKKWASDVSPTDPDICEASSGRPASIKPNTLKAKLMEARREGLQSRARTSKALHLKWTEAAT